MMEKDLVFFDGVCNLCSSSVQYIIRFDPKEKFKFSSLQSNFAQSTLKQNDQDKMKSIVLLSKDKLYFKSSAVLRIAAKLRFPVNILSVFILIPTFIRDMFYDYVAKKRYAWFGKKEQCWMPNDTSKNRFIE